MRRKVKKNISQAKRSLRLCLLLVSEGISAVREKTHSHARNQRISDYESSDLHLMIVIYDGVITRMRRIQIF
jgi:hypothetical protein